jgi:type I restriction enzyme S subunit
MKQGWEIKKLDEVCIVERGSSPRPIQKYLTASKDGVNWIKIGDTKDVDKYLYKTKNKITKEGALKSRLVVEGDFILSNSMSLGKPFIMRTTGYIHDGWYVLRLNINIDVDYFFYLLISPFVQTQFTSLASGAIVKNISSDLVKKTLLPIPPITQQKRIVVILDEAFAAIAKAKENAEKNLQNSKELFESYLQSVFANPGEDWEEKKLGDVCEVIAGQSPEGKYYNSKGNGLPFYQGKKEFSEKYIGVPTTWTTKITKEAEANDILMSVRAPVGPINFATQKICIGRGLAAIRTGKLIDKDFLFNFLLKLESEIIGSAGAVFNSINKAQIEAIEVPVPLLPEQKQIIAIIDELLTNTKKLESIYQQKLNDLEELKKSILQKAFNGEINTSKDIERI